MHLPRQEMRLLADHALAFHHRVTRGIVVNEPPAGAQLRGLFAHILDADVIPEDEL
ncbi:MAG: hypothetical protein RLZZ621_2408, partial [Gemmatimonadota bacterium]